MLLIKPNLGAQHTIDYRKHADHRWDAGMDLWTHMD